MVQQEENKSVTFNIDLLNKTFNKDKILELISKMQQKKQELKEFAMVIKNKIAQKSEMKELAKINEDNINVEEKKETKIKKSNSDIVVEKPVKSQPKFEIGVIRNNDRQNKTKNNNQTSKNERNQDKFQQRNGNFVKNRQDGDFSYSKNTGKYPNANQNQNAMQNKSANKATSFNKPINKKPIIEKPAEIAVVIKDNDRQFGNKKKTHTQPQEKKQLSVKKQMRMGIISKGSDDEDAVSYRKNKTKKVQKQEKQESLITHAFITTNTITVKSLSESISRPAAEIIKKLFILGVMCTINSVIDYDTAELVASELGVTIEKKVSQTFEEKLQETLEKQSEIDVANLVKRPPIVTVMGHVDHGKTSLLDAIRKTNVIAGEAGGITQHIGAYSVKTSSGERITFLDTPGHEAFSAMRQRGAQVTDIAILIVAADDGVMPQTKEAVKHIKAANVPCIVAINKMDKEDTNVNKLMTQLTEVGLQPEEWGGDTICVPISAKKGMNIDKLLDMVTLVADMQELKANPNAKAEGVVIESRLDKGLGPVATILINNGTLKVGDSVVSGVSFGKVRALIDENGKKVKKAGPSMPVSILGLDDVPTAGDKVNVIDEKILKQLVNERKNKIKEQKQATIAVSSLEDLFKKNTKTKVLNIIIKADVQGSAQALQDSILKIENEEVKIDVLTSEVGTINENDIMVADTSSNTMIIAFNQKVNPNAKILAEKNKADIRHYSVIYDALADVEAKAKSMMEPKYKEVPIGKAEVRAVFNLSSSGIIAGSYVLEGKIQRNAKCRVYRKDKLLNETTIIGLKNKKDDVKEIGVTFECGIKLENCDKIEVGDIIEAFILERIN